MHKFKIKKTLLRTVLDSFDIPFYQSKQNNIIIVKEVAQIFLNSVIRNKINTS